MKKGKTSQLSGFKTSKVIYGTVDSKDFKSLYLNLQTWLEPKQEPESWTRIVLNMSRSIKHSIYNHIDRSLFDEKFIVDMDLRVSGLQMNKKSFMNLEINFYLINEIDFKDNELTKKLKNIVKGIYNDVLDNNDYFDCFLTKNGNLKTNILKTEKV